MMWQVVINLTDEQIKKLEALVDIKIIDESDVEFAINVILENL